MSVILILIPLSIAFAVCFLAAFIWAVRSGQFEDTCTPSMRVLVNEVSTRKTTAPAGPRKDVAGNSSEEATNSIDAQTLAISEKSDAAPGG